MTTVLSNRLSLQPDSSVAPATISKRDRTLPPISSSSADQDFFDDRSITPTPAKLKKTQSIRENTPRFPSSDLAAFLRDTGPSNAFVPPSPPPVVAPAKLKKAASMSQNNHRFPSSDLAAFLRDTGPFVPPTSSPVVTDTLNDGGKRKGLRGAKSFFFNSKKKDSVSGVATSPRKESAASTSFFGTLRRGRSDSKSSTSGISSKDLFIPSLHSERDRSDSVSGDGLFVVTSPSQALSQLSRSSIPLGSSYRPSHSESSLPSPPVSANAADGPSVPLTPPRESDEPLVHLTPATPIPPRSPESINTPDLTPSSSEPVSPNPTVTDHIDNVPSILRSKIEETTEASTSAGLEDTKAEDDMVLLENVLGVRLDREVDKMPKISEEGIGLALTTDESRPPTAAADDRTPTIAIIEPEEERAPAGPEVEAIAATTESTATVVQTDVVEAEVAVAVAIEDAVPALPVEPSTEAAALVESTEGENAEVVTVVQETKDSSPISEPSHVEEASAPREELIMEREEDVVSPAPVGIDAEAASEELVIVTETLPEEVKEEVSVPAVVVTPSASPTQARLSTLSILEKRLPPTPPPTFPLPPSPSAPPSPITAAAAGIPLPPSPSTSLFPYPTQPTTTETNHLHFQSHQLTNALALQLTRYDQLSKYASKQKEEYERKVKVLEAERDALLKERQSWEVERRGFKWLVESSSATNADDATEKDKDQEKTARKVRASRSQTLPSIARPETPPKQPTKQDIISGRRISSPTLSTFPKFSLPLPPSPAPALPLPPNPNSKRPISAIAGPAVERVKATKSRPLSMDDVMRELGTLEKELMEGLKDKPSSQTAPSLEVLVSSA